MTLNLVNPNLGNGGNKGLYSREFGAAISAVPVSQAVRLSEDPITRIEECFGRFSRILARRHAVLQAYKKSKDKEDFLLAQEIGSGCTVNLSEIERTLRSLAPQGKRFELSEPRRKMLIKYGFDATLLVAAKSAAEGTKNEPIAPTFLRMFPFVWKLVNPSCQTAKQFIPHTYSGAGVEYFNTIA